MPAMEDVHVVSTSPELLDELEAFEAYDSEMRDLIALPYAEARDVLVAAEEARLEERCAMLIGSLPELVVGETPLTAPEHGETSPRLPRTPRGSTGVRAGGSPPTFLRASTAPRSSGCGRSPRPTSMPAIDFSSALSDLSSSTSSGAGVASEDAVSLSASFSESCCQNVEDDELCEASTGRLFPEALPVASATAAAKTVARKRPRCKECNCRLPLTATCASSCQCGDVFCAHHMHAHECSFDYHAREQRKLKDDNPQITPSKLERLG